MPQRFSPLRLTAVDAADLEPISAALQDAVAQLGDFDLSQRQKSFTIAFNRYCWERSRRKERVRCGFQVGHVMAARSRNIRQGAEDAVVSLLSVSFENSDDIDGEVVMTFSGDGELRLHVECLDIVLADISQPWPASSRPEHDFAGGESRE